MRTPLRLLAASLALWALWLLPTAARADVPPEPGYVEKCTIEKQCKKNEEGDACRAWHGDRDVCSRKHAADGFEYKCRTRGASVWSEVYCRAKADKPKKDAKPEPPKKDGK